jgi:hypothetical protein
MPFIVDAVNVIDINNLTVKELKAELRNRNIKFGTANKGDLLNLLLQSLSTNMIV